MTCSGRYASAEEYASLWCLDKPLNASERSAIEDALDMAAGDIHVARMTVGGCDCTLSSGALVYLGRLNLVLAAITRKCACAPVNLSDGERSAFLTWAQAQLDAISSGRLELCDGETGTAFPAFGWAEHAGTEFSRAEIIIKAEERYG